MSIMDLYAAEALLDDKERICLAGYLLMKGHDDKAKVKAYVYSRASLPQIDAKKLNDKAEKWFQTEQVQAFLKIWEEKGKILNDEARSKRQVEQPSEPQEQSSETMEIIREYERLRDEATDVMDKAKITTMIVNARHKNKDEVKEDTRTTRIYLPLRCSECVLYKKEKEKIV